MTIFTIYDIKNMIMEYLLGDHISFPESSETLNNMIKEKNGHIMRFISCIFYPREIILLNSHIPNLIFASSIILHNNTDEINRINIDSYCNEIVVMNNNIELLTFGKYLGMIAYVCDNKIIARIDTRIYSKIVSFGYLKTPDDIKLSLQIISPDSIRIPIVVLPYISYLSKQINTLVITNNECLIDPIINMNKLKNITTVQTGRYECKVYYSQNLKYHIAGDITNNITEVNIGKVDYTIPYQLYYDFVDYISSYYDEIGDPRILCISAALVDMVILPDDIKNVQILKSPNISLVDMTNGRFDNVEKIYCNPNMKGTEIIFPKNAKRLSVRNNECIYYKCEYVFADYSTKITKLSDFKLFS